MPRWKNPNPRQVMEDLIGGDPGDKSADTKTESSDDDTGKEISLATSHEPAVGDEIDGSQDFPLSLASYDWISASKQSPTSEGKPDEASSVMETYSEFINGDNLGYSMEIPGSNLSQVSMVVRSNEVRKPKNHSSAVLNPRVMTWMRNRFRIGTGGKISASDISNLYKNDTQHMENPPPGLQNYQVGQLLRRVFPDITRCKITVAGKRYWVYKHLNLIENPTEDLFEDGPKDEDNYEEGDVAKIAEVGSLGANESPTSNCEDTSMDGEEDAGDDAQKIVAIPSSFPDDKDKSNAILLGLLGRETKSDLSSTDEVGLGQNGGGVMKKKRDSEVIDWLKTSYKFKPGYYVKSMDLLRKYNNGRMEMVKYLSQVGRVMKHVFPGVRHLRKSFKGGKREWVYLNLKPVDVDSDSEEGKSMVMPTMRRSSGWYHSADPFPTDIQRSSPGWKRERVEISHTPLPAVSTKTVFKRQTDVFLPKSRGIDSRGITVKRINDDELPSLVPWTRLNDHGADDSHNEADLRDTLSEIGTGFHCSEDHLPRETAGGTSQIERDIFAPFSLAADSCPPVTEQTVERRMNTRLSSQNSAHLKACGESISNSDPSISQQMSAVNVNTSSSISGTRQHSNSCSPVLDLSVKGTSADTPLDKTEPVTVSDRFINAQRCKSIGFSTKPPALIRPKVSGNLRNLPTIHYHPNQMNKCSESFNAVNLEGSVNANRQLPEINSVRADCPISWRSLQAFSAQRFGWMRSPGSSSLFMNSEGDVRKRNPRYVEWFLVCGSSLVNEHRAMKEIKIYDDWTVEIHALGRRVYPNDLGGITDLEKTSESLNKVFRVLAEAKLCTGFPAPRLNDLYIHGILVSRFEVWSSREDSKEEIRQRAVNCQMMYSGPGGCCAKCTRIAKLYQQQKMSSRAGKRNSPDSPNSMEKRVKIEKL